MKQRAFIFDMDGTLVDNMAYHGRSWLEFFRRRGRTLDADTFFRRHTGRHSREILRDCFGPQLSEAECEAMIEEKETLYRTMYAPNQRALAGLEAFIAQARAGGFALAVGTSAPRANIQFTLDGLQLRKHFDAVVGAADVARGKPAPDVFLKAAQACGVAPADCIVFEDAPLGLEAARNAGMRAVALTTTMASDAFAGLPHVIAVAADYRALAPDALFAAA